MYAAHLDNLISLKISDFFVIRNLKLLLFTRRYDIIKSLFKTFLTVFIAFHFYIKKKKEKRKIYANFII